MKKVWERRSHAFPLHYTPGSISARKGKAPMPLFKQASDADHVSRFNAPCGACYHVGNNCWCRQ